jgi:chromosome segregation ATPase
MARRSKTAPQLGEHSIFGDEQAAQLRSELDELRATVRDLAGRLNAQFTTIAAHAEIAREQADFARSEARADLERTRDTLIDLVEQLRQETVNPMGHIAGSAPGPSTAAQSERFEAIEARLAEATDQVEACFARQRELADMVAAFLDTIVAEQRGEPVSGLSLT